MKKLIFSLILATILISSCSTRSGKVGNINMNDMTYKKDHKTGLCFSFMGAKQGGNFIDESSALGMACVPCDSIPKHLLK